MQQAVGPGWCDQALGGRLVRVRDKKMSNWFLKSSKSPEFAFLNRWTWRMLKSLAPWTPRDFSLACFTIIIGSLFFYVYFIQIVPFQTCWNWMVYQSSQFLASQTLTPYTSQIAKHRHALNKESTSDLLMYAPKNVLILMLVHY